MTELQLITSADSEAAATCLKLDTCIDKCLSSIKGMKEAVTFLKTVMDHPFHVEALQNIDGLIDEALIPYLDEIDKEFRNIAGV